MLDTTLFNSYLSVNLQTIINNMQSIQEDIGPDVECIPVLKDNAYCLGAVPIAKALCTYANVRTIAVAQVCEGVDGPLLPFWYWAACRSGYSRLRSSMGCSSPCSIRPLCMHWKNWPPRRENAPKDRSKLKPG